MNTIGNQVHITNVVYVTVGFQSVLMPPQQKLFQNEERRIFPQGRIRICLSSIWNFQTIQAASE